MKRISLTQDKFAIVDDWNYEWLNQYKWYAKKDHNIYYAYKGIKIAKNKRTIISMHRFILNAKKGQITDHRNHNGLDNQEHNLRRCTLSENQHNQIVRGKGTSKYKGVFWRKSRKRWVAQIKYHGKNIRVSYSINEDDAAKAYDKKARELFGEFACTNF